MRKKVVEELVPDLPSDVGILLFDFELALALATMSTTRHSTLFISSDRLNVLQSDALLPICTACGTQYPRTTDRCAICEDPRQYVPASGQSWTSLSELSFTRKHDLVRDEGDDRIGYIHTTPGFGINQTRRLH